MLETHHLKEVAARWKRFGLQLGCPFCELEAINPVQTPEDCLTMLLVTWIRLNKDKATVQALLDAVRGIGDHNLAENLEKNPVIIKIRQREQNVEQTDGADKNGVCKVYGEETGNRTKIFVVIVRRDKAGERNRVYAKDPWFEKEITVVGNLSLQYAEGCSDGTKSDITPREIPMPQFRSGQLCTFQFNANQKTRTLKLELAGVEPIDKEISFNLPQFVVCESTTAT